MKLLRLILAHSPASFLGSLVLSLLSAVMSVGVIAFINDRMLAAEAPSGSTLGGFAVLLAVLLVLAAGAQVAMTAIGHRFVYTMRRVLVKRLLDTDIERLETLGSANLLASLSADLRNITIAFVHLPVLLYGLVLALAAFAYLAWLSLPLFAITVLWMGVTMAIGGLLVVRLNGHLTRLREAEDRVYQDYVAAIDGRKELTLNRDRARRYYDDEFDISADRYRHHVTLADRYHSIASNWANIMMLGTIGLAFYLARGWQWASLPVASTYALTILFMRTPLVSAVAAIPAMISARVSLDKVSSLELASYQQGFEAPSDGSNSGWQSLSLEGVSYRYRSRQGEPGFDVGPIDLQLRRGEIIFLIGGNGSGKSTLARLITGLYRPHEGVIRLDGAVVNQDLRRLRRGIASVFTDFYLFDQLLGPRGSDADPERVQHWLEQLQLQRKVRVNEGRLENRELSQGQRKRLALLLALLEDREVLVLDEWAADQDPLFRRLFYRELLPCFKAMGKTVFAVTHDDHYFEAADRVLKMDGGQLVELSGEQRRQASLDAVGATEG